MMDKYDTDKMMMSGVTVYPVKHWTPQGSMTVECHREYEVGSYRYDLVLLKEKTEDEGTISTTYYVLDMKPHGEHHGAIPLTVQHLEDAVIVSSYEEGTGYTYYSEIDDEYLEKTVPVYRDDEVVHKEARALYDELWREASDESDVYTGWEGLSDMTILEKSCLAGDIMRDFPDEATLGYYRSVLEYASTDSFTAILRVAEAIRHTGGDITEDDLQKVGLSETDILHTGKALRDYYEDHKGYAAEHVKDVCQYDDDDLREELRAAHLETVPDMDEFGEYHREKDEVTDDEYEDEDE